MEGEVENLTDFEDYFDLFENVTCDDSCIEFMAGFWIEGVLVLLVAIFGILGLYQQKKLCFNFCNLGNVLCVFVFNNSSVDLKPSFSNILKCLSIFDILFLVRLYFMNVQNSNLYRLMIVDRSYHSLLSSLHLTLLHF